tara:strand:+ start:219 stop:395 length:177 start_codon:yes stop_codon:yes gene_type:complete
MSIEQDRIDKHLKREKLLKLLMESQEIIHKELTPYEVERTLTHEDLTYLQIALRGEQK